LDSDKEKEVEESQIQPIITGKEAKLAL